MRGIGLAPLLLALAGCDGGGPPAPRPGGAPAVVEDARILRAQLEIRQLAADLAHHHAARGEWPEDWRTIRRSGLDPWGNEYVFEVDGEDVVVTSSGPDGEMGTGDDIAGP